MALRGGGFTPGGEDHRPHRGEPASAGFKG